MQSQKIDLFDFKKQLLLVIGSSFLYGLAFCFPNYLWWIILFSLLPIWLLIIQGCCLFFLYGLLWGVITLFFLMFPLIIVTYFYCVGFLRLFAPIILIFYCAIYCGLWFYCTQKCIDLFLKYYANNVFSRMFIFTLITLLFFIIMHRYILFPFGLYGGYPFFLPLPLLMNIPVIIWIAYYCNWIFSLYVFIAFQGLIAYLFYYKKKIIWWTILFFLIVVYIFLGHYLINQKKQNNSEEYNKILNSIFFMIPPAFLCDVKTADQVACYMSNAISKIKYNNNNNNIFIFPESTFPFPYYEQSLAHKIIIDSFNYKQICIFGGHYLHDEKLYNSIFFVHRGRIIFRYDKKYLLPFFEYIPWLFKNISYINSFFLNQKDSFYHGKSNDASYIFNLNIHHFHNYNIIPIICSELFWENFTNKFYNKYDNKKQIGLCIVNDSFFHYTSFHILLVLYAKWISIKYNLPIIYSSHKYSSFINIL